MLRILRQGSHRIKRQAQYRRVVAALAGGQHHAARNGAGDKTLLGRALLHITRTPGRVLGAQGEAQLRIVGAGELVQLSGAGDRVEHVRKLGLAVNRICKGLRFHDKFRKLDLVQRPGAVGQLHTGLKRTVALARLRGFPGAGRHAQAFNGKRFAPGAARARHGGQGCFAGDHRVDGDRGNHVDQRIEPGFFLGRSQRGQRVQAGVPVKAGFLALRLRVKRSVSGWFSSDRVGLRLSGQVFAG